MSNTGKIYVGTSGWSYPRGEGTWNGYFYPPETKNELEHYSRFFDTVEINSTFYRPPAPAVSAGWVRKTPDDFIFSVKLWQKFTHPEMYRQATGEITSISAADVTLFKNSIEPLADSGKLGALLAQFPPSFVNDARCRQILQAVLHTFSDYPLVVELRHKSWSDDAQTAVLLRENHICWAQTDEPRFKFSIAAEVPQTLDISYFRFHGRNAETWWKGNVETRYMYHYSESEIAELSERVETANHTSRQTLVYFNNHWKAYAPRNARDLKKAMQLPFVDFPDVE
jgi:uncharacterized protein YecE (DUF72 family)